MDRLTVYPLPKWLLVWVLIVWTVSLHADDVLQEHAQRASAAMQRNDFATAETEYRAVLVMAPQLAEMRSNLGIALYMLGKFDQAEKEFRVALRSNPRLFVPNYFLGKRLFQTNRYAEARTFFQTASELKPDDVEARRWLGATYIGLKEYDNGINEFRKILKQEPQNVDALYAIGKTYTELMQLSLKRLPSAPDNLYRNLILIEARGNDPEWRSTAKSQLSRLIKANPAFPGLRCKLGNLELEEGIIDEARRHFEKEIVIDPFSLQAHFGLAQVWLTVRKYPDFAEELERAVGIRPEFLDPLPPLKVKSLRVDLEAAFQQTNSPLAKEFLAAQLGRESSFSRDLVPYKQKLVASVKSTTSTQELFRKKRYESAVSRLEGRQKLSVSEQLWLAQAYFEIGHFESAARIALGLARLPEAGDPVHYLLCRSYQKLAVLSLEELEQVAPPDSYRAHQLTGETMLAKEDYPRAVSAFQAALELKPDDAELTFQLGQSYYRLMDFPKAFESLHKCLELDPLNADAQYLIGEGLVYTKEGGKAIPFLQRALELNPSMLEAHAELGKAFLQRDQFEKAVKELELASTMDKSGDLHYLLYRAYSKLNQKEKAATALAQSNKLRERKRTHERHGLDASEQSAN